MCQVGDTVELTKRIVGYEPGATGTVDDELQSGDLVVTVTHDPNGKPTPFPLPPRDKSYFKKID